MRILLVALVLVWAASASAVTEDFSFATGSCATDGCAETEAFVHTNANEIADTLNEVASLVKIADPDEPGTTTGGIQEAIDACGEGVAGNNPSNGCTVKVACGDVPISTQIDVGGDTTATAKSGIRIIGCGSGSVNSAAVENPSVGGTTIVSSVADYGFKFRACTSCTIENLGFNGTDTSTGLLDIADSAASWPSSHVGIIDVDVERTTGYVLRTGSSSQADQIFVLRSTFRDNGGCLQQNYSQNLLSHFLQSECANMKSTGAKIGFDIVAGSLNFTNSFFGTSSTVSGQTGFRYGTSASVTIIRDSHLELVTNNNTLVDDNTGDGSGHAFGPNSFDGNQVVVSGTGNVCFDVATRGAWSVTNSHLQQTNACTSTFNMSNATDIASGDRLQFTTYNVVDNVGGDNIDNWDPTLGTGVVKHLLEPADIGVTVQAYDADLADLADGTLTGSKVGTGISATNITTGTIDSTARLPSEVIEESELALTSQINALMLDDDFVTENGTHNLIITGSALFSGTLNGGVSATTSSSTSVGPTAGQLLGHVYNYTSASGVDVTLPAAAAGLNACFRDGNGGGVVVIDAAAGDEIELDGTGVGVADAIDSAGTKGDFICLLALDATTWISLGRSGTWVDGGAD
jgi:hypothetical protein